MKCPECQLDLHSARPWNVPVEECPGCGGIWFESAALATYIRAADTHAFAAAGSDRRFIPTGQESRLACPHGCASTVRPGFSGSLFLHRCSQCSGIFVAASQLRSLRPHPSALARTDLDPLVNAVGTSVNGSLIGLDTLDLLASILQWP